MLYKKLSEEELALLEIMENPVWNAEFLRKEADPEWELTSYQREIIADSSNYISFRAGRAVGKSETLIDTVVYYATNNFFATPTIAIVTPNRVHLEPLWRKLTRWLRVHPFLRFYFSSINSQNFTITLSNGVVIDCRIGGVAGTGASVIGLHTPVLVVDEAGFMDWRVWTELVPTINSWEKGFKVYVCGTPSGVRDGNVLYFADVESNEYNHHRVSAKQNPRYTASDERRNREQYGGEDSDDYRRLVLGEHGAQVLQLFGRDTLPLINSALFTATLTGDDLVNDPQKIIRLEESLPISNGNLAFGIDLGYTDPTIISIFEKDGNYWTNIARVTLQHIEYPDQLKIIDMLDSLYSPLFLAIDEGSSGLAAIQSLYSEPRYATKNYAKRIVGVNFGDFAVIGFDLDGVEIKERIKVIAVEKLRSYLNQNTIKIPAKDEKLLSELERVEKVRSETGTVYRVRSVGGNGLGSDHIFASYICFSYGLFQFLDNVREPVKPKLFVSKWVRK